MSHLRLFAVLPLVLAPLGAQGGPYAPAAGQEGSTAIHRQDAGIVAWASAVANYSPGSDVEDYWKNTANALGPAEGLSDQGVVSLGRGGSITLTFPRPIANGNGPDFAVFENAFRNSSAAAGWFLELAWVEVSSDGSNFHRFPNYSLTASPVGGFGSLDPTNIHNLAGKYERGYGTPFDLQDLAGSGGLNLGAVTHVRIVDIVGNGTARDSENRVIYDPFPTLLSAGFDLDAVAVLHERAANPMQFGATASDGGVQLTWLSQSGATYRVEESADGSAWAQVTIVGGTGGLVSHTVPAGGERRFYRVVRQ